MSKKVKRVSELPEWFSLDKYDGVKGLNSAGWYEQLSVRKDISGLVGSPRWKSWTETESHDRIDIRVLETLRENPLPDIAGNDLLRAYFYGGAMHEIKSRDPRYSLGVHLATVRNLYRTEGNIEREKRDYARKFFAQFENHDWLSETPIKFKYVDWIDEPVDLFACSASFGVNVSVNLLVPDKLLVEQFKQMLKDLRRKGLGMENCAKSDFLGWSRFGVLPYLDLKIWEHETGMKIPNRVMADAIFPPGEGGEEVVRKTTAKLAQELLTRKSLEILASIAAHEIAEQNTG